MERMAMQPMPAKASTARSRLLSCEVAAVCLVRVGVGAGVGVRVGVGVAAVCVSSCAARKVKLPEARPCHVWVRVRVGVRGWGYRDETLGGRRALVRVRIRVRVRDRDRARARVRVRVTWPSESTPRPVRMPSGGLADASGEAALSLTQLWRGRRASWPTPLAGSG
eukprot:scaffold46904_cov42-Phaeocystis_antarctica.AAC.3